ncbi:MAG: DinB family protein [Blastocatellia bacterium]
MTFRNTRPQSDEHAEWPGKYIALVPDGDIAAAIKRQGEEVAALIASLTETQGDYRYAPDKWTLKEVIGHMADGERVMAYRLLRFARNDLTELPGFDENVFGAHAPFARYTLAELTADYQAVRAATLSLLAGLDEAAFSRRGLANHNTLSVRALAWIIAGHELHHLNIIRERYLH